MEKEISLIEVINKGIYYAEGAAGVLLKYKGSESYLSEEEKSKVIAYIRELKDHRRWQGKRYPIQIAVMIILMGIMSGATPQSERGILKLVMEKIL